MIILTDSNEIALYIPSRLLETYAAGASACCSKPDFLSP